MLIDNIGGETISFIISVHIIIHFDYIFKNNNQINGTISIQINISLLSIQNFLFIKMSCYFNIWPKYHALPLSFKEDCYLAHCKHQINI